MKKHTHALAAATAAALLALTGCQSSDSKAEPSETTTPTAKPSEDPSPWAKKYTKKQLADYNAALQKWEEYEQRSEPYWAEGKATREAQDFFQDYWFNSNDTIYRELEENDRVDVQLKGTATTLTSRPVGIKPGQVKILQCVDYTSRAGYQKGKPMRNPVKRPLRRVVLLADAGGKHGWLIVNQTPETELKSCKS